MSSKRLANNNQVPEGYKKTEVGVIPEDWEVLRIKDIAPLQRGFDLPTSQVKKGNYPVVYSNGVMNYHSKFMVNGPGVITGRSGTIGNVHYVSENYWPHNTALWVTDFIDSHPKYIYYLYKSLKLERFGTGSGVPTLNRNDVHDLTVAIPKLKEQKAIASVLSDVDALIAALDKLIAKKRNIKTGTMQQLLTGKTRLPGFGEGKGYKKTEVGVIPEDWKVIKIENFGSNTIPPIKAGPFGSHLTKNTYVCSGYKIYGQEQVIRGDYLYGDYFISAQKFKELESCAVRPGDILLSLVGTIGKLLVIPENAPLGIINPRLIRLSFDKDIVNPQFFKELFESSKLQGFLARYAQGGTMGVLNAGILRTVSIGLPSITEQKAIAQVLSDMDKEITALEKRRAKTQAIKQGMMQELLTGRTRLI